MLSKSPVQIIQTSTGEGQSLGYGFVNYKSTDHAMKAIEALNGLRLQNKTIKVSLARPSCDLIKGANLYVSGLPKTMTQRELESMFSPCGNIITSRILCDPQTGFSKGVGFVRFDLRTEAEMAIKQLNGTIPVGSSEPMTVKFANHPSSIHSIASFPAAVASYLAPARQLIAPIHTHATTGRLRYTAIDSTIAPQLPNGIGNVVNGWCVFVYNLAPETEENILWQLFGPFGAVQNVKVMRDYTTQKCKGFGFVTMTNYEEALIAISYLNGYQLGNRILQVSFKKMRNMPPPGSILSNA